MRAARWLGAALRVPREDYTWVRDFDEVSGPARADSWLWCDLLFRPEASPHREAPAPRHGFHVATETTIDLLRHEYEACGLDLVVTEGRNFVVVEAARACPEAPAGGARHRAAAIRDVTQALFADAGEGPGVARAAPLSLVTGDAFELNAGADPLLLGRCAERVDGRICGTALQFLLYKKSPQRVGYLDACQWFDEDFRRARGR